MSKFDELKKLAQRSATGDDVDATDAMHKMLQGVDVLELLAIQAQLVEALKEMTQAMESGFKIEYGSGCYISAVDAIDAAGAQP